ncbi:50S ribosomal protein L5 [Candidatus Poribacteria bacterium]|jgi:large subunit ribosomal protein L5|nr:50S ribosomal protein L5 [Candidatus Poribacteria bacterium]MEE2912054.1 50S ribosomal protein L5 [Candidatus Poribacteria bacterium]|tara:strand:- start:635 stop:1174 length:540 start_codon:yes stop_codon:yes gene_type:complete
MSTLKEFYTGEVIPELQRQFGYKSPMQLPKLRHITLNMGVGEAVQTPKLLENATEELSLIAGQRAVITRAKKSIANFKIRDGMPIGCKVTLRRNHMYEFYNKLVNVVLPQLRDFRGISPNSFDGRGNYSLGLQEQVIFPEISYDKVSEVRGLNISIVTTATTDEEGRELLKLMGMPFRD